MMIFASASLSAGGGGARWEEDSVGEAGEPGAVGAAVPPVAMGMFRAAAVAVVVMPRDTEVWPQ